MNSLIVGIARTGKPGNQVLNTEMRYISMCGSKPEVSFSINCGQDEFLKMVNKLRYDDANPASSARAISFFEELTTKLLKDLEYVSINEKDTAPLHIRLVTSPLEIAQIPFEFARLPSNAPAEATASLLTSDKKVITLTREVRQESETRYTWPCMPRVLFAWAAPSNGVPHEEHCAVLTELLGPLAKPKEDVPYPEPGIDALFTELPNASLRSISEEIKRAVAGDRHYTHVNILAHGGHKAGNAGFEFRLILCKDGQPDVADKIDGDALVNAIVTGEASGVPTVISLSACDSGNIGSTIVSSGSLAYQLHNAGLPCVFASQFPLTDKGSVTMVKTLYARLINGGDPRSALYDTRIALKEGQNHDWASLVAYTRFPDDINEQLQDARLNLLFNSMKTTNAWVDHVFKFMEKIPAEKKEQALQDLESRLNKSIEQLSAFLHQENKQESSLGTELLRAEHLGLLGSALKRKAEYLYRLIEFNPAKNADLASQSLSALNEAKKFYNCGFEANAASHWNAMQYLSLKAVLDGSVESESETWTIIKFMAQRDEKNAKSDGERGWAWGTLAELYMLKPFTVRATPASEDVTAAMAIAKEYMNKISGMAPEHNAKKESTARQFERYISWWPDLSPGTFPKELREMAIEIRGMLPELNVLL